MKNSKKIGIFGSAVIAAGLLFGLISSCQALLSTSKIATADDAPEKRNLKLVWLSLDALNAANLKPYLDLIKTPHPHGLKWMLDQAHGKHNLQVSYPSITAPSHISTLTCAGPGTHGVFLNAGNWNGERDLNGFAMPYTTENWVQALRKSGIKVGVASYPSIDGSSPERSADLGIAYDSPKGKVQYVKISAQAQNLTSSVALPSHLIADKIYHESVTLRPTGEISLDGDIGTSSGFEVGEPKDLYFVDGEGPTARKAAVTIMNLGVRNGETTIAVSPVSVMPVTNSYLQSVLDQKNIVWSNLRDYGLAQYGDGVDLPLKAVRHRRKIELQAIQEMLKLNSSDVLFLYFEDIDTILHAWSGVTKLNSQLATFLAEFDQDLGTLVESLPSDVNLVVMGDHGMTAVQYELNARKLLPAGMAKNFQIRASGGTLVLYPAGNFDAELLKDPNLEVVATALRDATVEFDQNRKIFRKIVINGSADAQALGVSGAKSPLLLAFADEGISLVDRTDDRFLLSHREGFEIPEGLHERYPEPTNNGVLVQPSPLGAHGHDSALPSMWTHLTLAGPQLDAVDLSLVGTNIQVVPTVASALGWQKPSSCR